MLHQKTSQFYRQFIKRGPNGLYALKFDGRADCTDTEFIYNALYPAVAGKGYYICQIGDKMGVLTCTGREVVPPEVDEIDGFTNGCITVIRNGKEGYYFENYDDYIYPAYDESEPLEIGKVLHVRKGDLWGYITLRHRFITDKDIFFGPREALFGNTDTAKLLCDFAIESAGIFLPGYDLFTNDRPGGSIDCPIVIDSDLDFYVSAEYLIVKRLMAFSFYLYTPKFVNQRLIEKDGRYFDCLTYKISKEVEGEPDKVEFWFDITRGYQAILHRHK